MFLDEMKELGWFSSIAEQLKKTFTLEGKWKKDFDLCGRIDENFVETFRHVPKER